MHYLQSMNTPTLKQNKQEKQDFAEKILRFKADSKTWLLVGNHN